MSARVYIAGPLSAGDQFLNVRAALDAARDVRAAGHLPFVPHLSAFAHLVHAQPYAVWIDEDLAWLECCDALLRLEGESPGADAEVARARELGMPVYHSVDQMARELEGRRPERVVSDLVQRLVRDVEELRAQVKVLKSGHVSRAEQDAERFRALENADVRHSCDVRKLASIHDHKMLEGRVRALEGKSTPLGDEFDARVRALEVSCATVQSVAQLSDRLAAVDKRERDTRLGLTGRMQRIEQQQDHAAGYPNT